MLVAAKISVIGTDTGDGIAAAIDGAEERIRSAVPEATHIYLEPDIFRDVEPSRADPEPSATG
jgi:hypothetical protein